MGRPENQRHRQFLKRYPLATCNPSTQCPRSSISTPNPAAFPSRELISKQPDRHSTERVDATTRGLGGESSVHFRAKRRTGFARRLWLLVLGSALTTATAQAQNSNPAFQTFLRPHLWVAREHIRQLAAVYCHRIAFGDVDGVVDLFVGDGGMHVLGELHSGHEALRKLYTESLEVRHIKHIHNHVVEVDGDTAPGRG